MSTMILYLTFCSISMSSPNCHTEKYQLKTDTWTHCMKIGNREKFENIFIYSEIKEYIEKVECVQISLF